VSSPRIVVYTRPLCSWCIEVKDLLREYNLGFTEKDVSKSETHLHEMRRKTGQNFVPCLEIDGYILADVGGQEVKDFLLDKGYLRGT